VPAKWKGDQPLDLGGAGSDLFEVALAAQEAPVHTNVGGASNVCGKKGDTPSERQLESKTQLAFSAGACDGVVAVQVRHNSVRDDGIRNSR
jgi:hypothetical protein